ncbi:pentatricopeptide repeat-containing protein At5g18950-like [Macadamia integrifolia]|uniref:pentatricopeptide repeat-containing protein At5g18950-like n=1 Tax=Macadamia integrifolia TaxID=60698 RepID=UPI001C4F0EB7|nr:pentatricopeptide repeat-containing protein At5g18950-like [Macadamia integrifolia]
MAPSSSSLIVNFLCQNIRRIQNPQRHGKTIRNLVVKGGDGTQQEPQIVDGKLQLQFTEQMAIEVCNTIRTRPRWEQTLLSDFPSLNHCMFDPNCFGEIIKRQNNAFLSFRFFQWVSSHPGFSPGPQFCSVLFDTLVEAKAAKAAKSFLLTFPGFQPQPSSLESFIRCLCDDGAIYDALGVFSQLKNLNFMPALSVWNSALLGSLRIERTDLVWDLYAKMMESGLVGDVDTVGYLIRAFCKDNKLSEAYELLRQVIEAGHTPDNIAFTKLISGFCRDGNYAKVSELLHLMIAKGRLPDIFTYQEIIFGLCKNGMGNEALRVFSDLKDRGYAPDRVMYTTVIDGLCKMGRLGEARKLWFEMIHKGLKPNEYTYNALMDGYCKAGNLEKAQELHREMCDRGYRESTVSYNTLIAGFCLHGKTDKAHQLFEEMPTRGTNRDVITYNTLIQGLCKEGKVVEAMNLFNELMVMDLQPSTSSYTPLIQALCEEGKAQEAIELWKDMQNRSLEPLVCTHDYIITGLCKQGNPAEGMEWLTKMLTSKLRPRRKTFNRLVEAFSSNDQFDDALLVLDYLFGMDYTLEEPVCHSLISQLCKENLCGAQEEIEAVLGRD